MQLPILSSEADVDEFIGLITADRSTPFDSVLLDFKQRLGLLFDAIASLPAPKPTNIVKDSSGTVTSFTLVSIPDTSEYRSTVNNMCDAFLEIYSTADIKKKDRDAAIKAPVIVELRDLIMTIVKRDGSFDLSKEPPPEFNALTSRLRESAPRGVTRGYNVMRTDIQQYLDQIREDLKADQQLLQTCTANSEIQLKRLTDAETSLASTLSNLNDVSSKVKELEIKTNADSASLEKCKSDFSTSKAEMVAILDKCKGDLTNTSKTLTSVRDTCQRDAAALTTQNVQCSTSLFYMKVIAAVATVACLYYMLKK
jgi:hypothetical protein